MSFWFCGLSAAAGDGNFLHDDRDPHWVGARNLDQGVGHVGVSHEGCTIDGPAHVERVRDRRLDGLHMLLRSSDCDGRWIHLDSLQGITGGKGPRDPWLHWNLTCETRVEREMELTGNYLHHLKLGRPV